ncbi:MAG TPA: CdaR family protein [Pyrinomonadaceae bacterium]|jgi:YbbR domain-containing protein|nr:CdaR family protein [Pyrinomonadaceae bacterium]
MAFRIERQKKGESRGALARWLRALLFEDWTLKALALAITLGLWFAVTTQRTPATMRLHNVPLEFVLPEGVEIGNDPTKVVEVTLQGSRGKLDEMNVANLVARADVTALRPGDRVARLFEAVRMDLPEDVRIIEVTPRSVTLHLETVVERDVPVEARFEGELPAGFRQTSVAVTPERVRVRGPESHVNSIERAFTETISLSDLRESHTFQQVAVDISDHKVTPLDASVGVRVEVSEEQSEHRFTNVQVRTPSGSPASPATANVLLRGPRSVIESLRPEDVRLVVEPTEDGPAAPRLSLPPNAQGRVELVSTTPTHFGFDR